MQNYVAPIPYQKKTAKKLRSFRPIRLIKSQESGAQTG